MVAQQRRAKVQYPEWLGCAIDGIWKRHPPKSCCDDWDGTVVMKVLVHEFVAKESRCDMTFSNSSPSAVDACTELSNECSTLSGLLRKGSGPSPARAAVVRDVGAILYRENGLVQVRRGIGTVRCVIGLCGGQGGGSRLS